MAYMKLKRILKLRLVILSLILCSCIGCDQATKGIANQRLRDSPPRSFLANTVRLEYALNPGGFLSFGADLAPEVQKWVFIGLNSLIMLGVCLYLFARRRAPIMVFVSISLILAGGVGNLIDRMSQNGFVTDFLNVGIGSLRTGIFNIADIAVLFGALGVAILSLRGSDQGTPPQIAKT